MQTDLSEAKDALLSLADLGLAVGLAHVFQLLGQSSLPEGPGTKALVDPDFRRVLTSLWMIA